jgi:hypothetical protein
VVPDLSASLVELATIEEDRMTSQPVEPAPVRSAPLIAVAAQPSPPLELPPDADGLGDVDVEALKARLGQAVAEHDVSIDPWMFNAGTVSTLILTAAATFVPSLGPKVPAFVAPLCSGIAGVLIAAERALGFGARWRYHREMRSAYQSIIDMLDFCPLVPRSERAKYVRDIFTALYAVRSRESAIPNAGTNTPPT